ncbi:unnamed protein product [Brassica oleracea var. botrytis]
MSKQEQLTPFKNFMLPKARRFIALLSFAAVRFRFHAYEDIQANFGLRGDLYGNLCYLLNQLHFNLCRWPLEADEWTVLEEAEIINMRHVLLYLWDQASKDFYKKSTSSEDTSNVILVTTVNPKRLGDVQPTINYNWLSSNPKIAKRLNADEVTRAETMTIGQILAYIKQEYAKEGSFDCIATIDDVERDSAWYYIVIACIGCQSKTIKGPYSLMCAKCGNTNISPSTTITTGFVILGDAGHELTGKNAVELVNNYFEANQELAVAHEMSAPPPPPLPPSPKL